MLKKAQISLFVIIGILIIAAIIFASYYASIITIESPKENSQIVAPVQQFTEECLKKIGTDAAYFVAKRGGYYNDTELMAPYDSSKTAYYFYSKKNVMPSKEAVQTELGRYVSDNIFICTKNYADLAKEGIIAEGGGIKTNAIIFSDKISYETNYPLTLRKGDSTARLEKFYAEAGNIRLGEMLDSAKNLTEIQVQNPNSIMMSDIFKETTRTGFVINLFTLDNETIIFTITDQKNNLTLAYANKYE